MDQISLAILRVGPIEGDEGAIGRGFSAGCSCRRRASVPVASPFRLNHVSRLSFPSVRRETIRLPSSEASNSARSARRDVADTLDHGDGFAEKNGAFGVELLGEQPSVAIWNSSAPIDPSRGGNIGGVRSKRHHSLSVGRNRWTL